MSAIEGATVNLRTMADGTLRITIDVEPGSAQAAFALFGAPGTPVALAALKVGHAMASDERVAAAEPKGGPLAQWLAQRCNEGAFREWAMRSLKLPESFYTNAEISNVVCQHIGVNRKREIDGDQYAPTRLKTLVMQPYGDWLKTRGAA